VPADPSRDYEEFNLGNEVYRLLQGAPLNRTWSSYRRYFAGAEGSFRGRVVSAGRPIELLGEVSLEDIASEIAESATSSPARKRVYRGLRAVQAVCVGDIGDVVKLYEKILQRAKVTDVTISRGKAKRLLPRTLGRPDAFSKSSRSNTRRA